MPLLDHFHPPLSQHRHWESLHGAWANALAVQLNHGLLPARYFAEPHVKVGTRVEVDVGTFEEGRHATSGENGGVAVWAPSRPALIADLSFGNLDLFEVQVVNDEEGPQVVAAIELVSPANKDRASHRQMFAVKCASYLQQGISVVLADVVTKRSGNLHRELLQLLEVTTPTPADQPTDLYAGAYRIVCTREAQKLEAWVELLTVGTALSTLPLWLRPDLSVPLNLEQAYVTACTSLRIG
jgi:hypothetical protein